jgi:hypothetical protein
VVGKSSSAAALLGAIREVARAPRLRPPVSRQMRAGAAARLDPADHAILAMRLAGDSGADIGAVLGLPAPAIADRIAAIVGVLSTARPSPVDRSAEPAAAGSVA